MPFRMPVSAAARPCSSPPSPVPAGVGLNLACVGRADGDETLRVIETRLEERDPAVVLHAIHREHRVRQPERVQVMRVEDALVTDVVDGRHRCRALATCKPQVSRSERGRPVVAVQDLRGPRHASVVAAEQRSDTRQQAEAQVIVGPVVERLVLIGRAGPNVILRAIDEEQRRAVHLARIEQAALRIRAAQRRECSDRAQLCLQGLQHGAVAPERARAHRCRARAAPPGARR